MDGVEEVYRSHRRRASTLSRVQRSANTKGKWRLVGAAWGGDPLVEHQQESHCQAESESAPDAPSENVLLELAKKQGMNTDIRKAFLLC